MRYFTDLSFLGAAYHGWQRQPGDMTVQEMVENAFSTILRQPIAVTGAGRTDAGVNARQMIAHFDSEEELADPRKLVKQLNSYLPKDIAINSIYPVEKEKHARFDAVARTYRYYAVERKSPFFFPLAWKASGNLDYDAMNQAASLLLGRKDFTSFSKLHTDVKTNICNVTHASWQDWECGKMFVITSDRFLRNMVRAVVGTLVEVGRGRINLEKFQRIIDLKDRGEAGTSMPAHALYLWEVKY